MANFKFIIQSPYKTIFDEEVNRVTVKTIEGEFSILSGFENFLTSTVRGKVQIEKEVDELLEINLLQGFLKVENSEVCLLADLED